jgi:hypothetical protein
MSTVVEQGKGVCIEFVSDLAKYVWYSSLVSEDDLADFLDDEISSCVEELGYDEEDVTIISDVNSEIDADTNAEIDVLTVSIENPYGICTVVNFPITTETSPMFPKSVNLEIEHYLKLKNPSSLQGIATPLNKDENNQLGEFEQYRVNLQKEFLSQQAEDLKTMKDVCVVFLKS